MFLLKGLSKINEARYILIFFSFVGKDKSHRRIRKVDKTINGIDIPSTPRVNLRFSLLNQSKEFTNWKWGISLLN